MNRKPDLDVGLPPRPFLYTLDQIADLLMVEQRRLRDTYIWYDGRTVGDKKLDYIVAHNIAPEDATPDWRVMDKELVRWMRRKGFRIYERNPYRHG